MVYGSICIVIIYFCRYKSFVKVVTVVKVVQ
jgi:hypothetical protein